VSGNLIGTDATGTAAVPNLIGVFILGASGNFVGASPLPTNLYGGNRIAFNDRSGLDATVGRANSFLANSIFSNGRLGIDLNADGVTPNDPGDADTGPNDLQNYPVLTLASSGVFKTEIHGSLNSAPSREYRIQLFFNTSCDPSGFGEGEEFIDEIFVTTDASGNAAFKHSTSPAVPGGSFITATATDPEGNTSEFSVCKKVVGRVPH